MKTKILILIASISIMLVSCENNRSYAPEPKPQFSVFMFKNPDYYNHLIVHDGHFQQVEKPTYEQQPPAAQFMIEHYEEVIAFANDSCQNCPQNEHWMVLLQSSDNSTTTARGTPIVSPLLSVHWKQTGNNSDTPDCNKVYNKFCPNVTAPNQCNKAAVGCVAVAIGQIMVLALAICRSCSYDFRWG